MSISKDQVEKVAKLVKIKLTEEQTEKLSAMFSDTLDKIAVLKELDTSKVNETFSVTGTQNIFSDPVKNKATLKKEVALSQTKEQVKGLFATTAVFER